MFLDAKQFFCRTLLPLASGRAIEGLNQRVMDDPQLVLNPVPIRPSPEFDREVSVIHVGEPEDLSPVVQIQIRLFRCYAVEVRRFDFGEHIGEDVGIGFESHDTGVEVDRESSAVCVHIRNGPEDEGNFEEFVKVAPDMGVSVDVDGALDPHGVERPDPQLGVLVDESRPNTLSIVRRLY